MKTEITELTQENILEFAKLRLEAVTLEPLAFGVTPEEEKTFLKENLPKYFLNNDFLKVFGARHNDEWVGIIQIERGRYTMSRHTCWIQSFYVAPKARSFNLSYQLYKKVEEQIAKFGGIEIVELWVLGSKTRVISLYERVGFKVTGKREKAVFYNGIYYDRLLMRKML